MLSKLNKQKENLIREYCKIRFDINPNIFNYYNWYHGSKNRIYIGPEEIERIKPESIGLCIFRLDKTPKPTTNFIQLFGNEIKKNIIKLNKDKTLDFCKGRNIKMKSKLEPGFVAVKYDNINLGCGHWNGKVVKNQIPKSKFCKINFL